MINFKHKRAGDRALLFEAFWQDLKFGVRALAKRPLFTGIAILTLSLGVGATTAVFSLANWLLLRPVPGVDTEAELAIVRFGIRSERGFSPYSVSPWNQIDLLEGTPALTHLAGYQLAGLNIAATGVTPEHLFGVFVEGDYFDALGIAPAAGRVIRDADDEIAQGRLVTVLSHELALRFFGDATAAVGHDVQVNAVRYTVIGVAPPGFHGVERRARVDLWLPGDTYGSAYHFSDESQARVRQRSAGIFHNFIVRLTAGASFEQAREQLTAGNMHLVELYPEDNAHFQEIRPELHEGIGIPIGMRDRAHRVVSLLTIVAGIVLLIACANTAGLLVSRGVERRSEYGVRKALGVGRGRLIGLHLTESLLVTVPAAIGGIAIALALNSLFQGTIVLGLPAVERLPLDWRVLGFTTGLALIMGIVLGVVPGLWAARTDVVKWISNGTRHEPPKANFVRNTFSTVQLASCIILVIGATLFVRTIRNYQAVDLGFNPDGVVAFYVDPRSQGYDQVQTRNYRDRLLTEISSLPEVEAVSISSNAPFSRGTFRSRVHRPDQTPDDHLLVPTNAGTGDFFSVLHQPLVAGRSFEFQDYELPRAEQPVIVNETLANQLFGSTNVVGRTVVFVATRVNPATSHRVVGVVGDTRTLDFTGAPTPRLYEPLGNQSYASFSTTILVRSDRPLQEVVRAVENAAARVDATLPVFSGKSILQRIEQVTAEARLFARVLTMFSIMALVLSAIGLYGVVAFNVADRVREFGIRISLGARSGQIMSGVMRQSIRVSILGTLIGCAGALGLAQYVESRLFGVTPLEPLAYLSGAGALVLVTVVATLGPARRATNVDPVVALRQE